MELPSKYNPQDVENKWLKIWKDNGIFHAKVTSEKLPFTIVIPPPNVTGILHMGHALNNTLQDILVRYQRMNGRETLWMPGTDHAGIATQNVVEKQLAKEGKHRSDLGRSEFIKRLWAWKQDYGDTIIRQLEKLGFSCDWSRTRFTMDEAYSDAVKEAFVRLYRKGLIYRGEYIINWCPRCQTALSDEEAEHHNKNGKLYHIKYLLKSSVIESEAKQSFKAQEFAALLERIPRSDGGDCVIVATTRPETMLGDVAVAVNPKDERYRHLIGKILILPLLNRGIPIIADDFVATEFGTGAVKVTPAHDSNDFMMGQRHHLPMINVMHPDARINEKGGKYNGLDRFEARKQIVADLDALGLLVKVEDHAHAVGHCYRCDTVVEPYLSKQWFVKMKPLAEPAVNAVKNGTIKIRPEHWEKVYLNWMGEIRDWCISRQIWWGHRIPVWYDGQGNIFVAQDEIEANALAQAHHGHAVELRQDEDVLDTWFSSWLWPFATLGWPKETPDLKYFYPTHSLMTASEILFFWVARMIMAGYEFMGEKPFSDVFIHGTVRDAKGRKMSKSLGNAIDPLEIIREYGADALRFSLIINSGQDIFISKEKFEIGRNFANKIWNASRLVLMNTSVVIPAKAGIQSTGSTIKALTLVPGTSKGRGDDIDVGQLDLPSRWIIARLDETITKVSAAIEGYRYSEAENLIQEFFWGNYCDWYLELIKTRFNEMPIQQTALFVLANSLKIIHPFMPFVTEEVYSQLSLGHESLSLTPWPKIQDSFIDHEAKKKMQLIIDIITWVRNTRTQWHIKPQDLVEALIIPNDLVTVQLLESNRLDIQKLAKISLLKIDRTAKVMQDAATGIVGPHKIFIPLAGLIDINDQKNKMALEIAQKQKAKQALAGRLKNPTFVDKAPEDVIAKEKERLQVLNHEIAELENILNNLS